MKFLQEKVAGIDSGTRTVKKLKSPVATTHVNGIAAVYNNLIEENDRKTDEENDEKTDEKTDDELLSDDDLE